MRYLKAVATLKIDQGRCTGCGFCLNVCPHEAIALDDEKAAVQDLDACMECGACAKNCPVTAITVDAGVGCASGIINEWLREHNIRGVSSGCCS